MGCLNLFSGIFLVLRCWALLSDALAALFTVYSFMLICATVRALWSLPTLVILYYHFLHLIHIHQSNLQNKKRYTGLCGKLLDRKALTWLIMARVKCLHWKGGYPWLNFAFLDWLSTEHWSVCASVYKRISCVSVKFERGDMTDRAVVHLFKKYRLTCHWPELTPLLLKIHTGPLLLTQQ